MKTNYDVVIVGGGVIGSAVARELSRYKLSICVLEKELDVCNGTSGRNTGLLHSGILHEKGTLRAICSMEGNAEFETVAAELDVPFRRCGKLIVGFGDEERKRLEKFYQRGLDNGIPGLRMIDHEELKKIEPSAEGDFALLVPTAGILCPFTYTIALAENAAANGCVFRFNTEVSRIERRGGFFRLHTGGDFIDARVVISAAGVHGDALHNQLCEEKLTIVPRRGEYCLLDRTCGQLVRHTIFQLPSAMGKGVLVTPTVHGNLLVGPTAVDQPDKDRTATTAEGLRSVAETAAKSVENLPMRDVITSFAGLRAHLSGPEDDFIVGESADGFFEAVGIESPGLSSAPAIGRYLAELAAEKLHAAEKPDFIAQRRDIPHPREMDFAARQALIARDPAYGQVICRCEGVTEGEIRDAIRRTPGARSLDGVKRRVRAGMGRCQGGFCGPKVMELLSRELHVPITELTKGGGESRLLAGRTKEVL